MTKTVRWIGVSIGAFLVAMAACFSIVPRFQTDGSGEAWALGPPITVRFTGAFYPPEDKEDAKQHARHLLRVGIKKAEWIFAVQDVNVISASITDNRVLNALQPPRMLRLVGAEALLGQVKAPDIVGKRVTMKGYLRLQERMLEVAELTLLPAESTQKGWPGAMHSLCASWRSAGLAQQWPSKSGS